MALRVAHSAEHSVGAPSAGQTAAQSALSSANLDDNMGRSEPSTVEKPAVERL
jgi:hypothetical protein